MVLGSTLYSYAISSFSNLFLTQSKQIEEYKNKMNTLASIAEENSICNSLLYKLKRTIKKNYQKNDKDKYEFLESMPSNIKSELMLRMYENRINDNKFFVKRKHDFILFVLPKLKYETILKNDVLISTDEVVEQMYFVIKGLLSVNMGVQYHNIQISGIKKSEYYGDLFMYSNKQSPFEIKCKKSDTEVMTMEKSDYLKLLNNYSIEVLEILGKSSNYIMKIHKKRQLCIELFSKEKVSSKIRTKMKRINLLMFDEEFMNWFENGEDSEVMSGEEKFDFNDTLVRKKESHDPMSEQVIPDIKMEGESIQDDTFVNINNNRPYDNISQKKLVNDTFPVERTNDKTKHSKRRSRKLSLKRKFNIFYREIVKKFGSKKNTALALKEYNLNKMTQKMFTSNDFISTNDIRNYRNQGDYTFKSMNFTNVPQHKNTLSFICKPNRNHENISNKLRNLLQIEKAIDIHLIKEKNTSNKDEKTSSNNIIIPEKINQINILGHRNKTKKICYCRFEEDIIKHQRSEENIKKENICFIDSSYKHINKKDVLKLRKLISLDKMEGNTISIYFDKLEYSLDKKLDRIIDVLNSNLANTLKSGINYNFN